MEEYFTYIKEKENDLWVATFADVTKYIRERKSIEITSVLKDETIVLTLSSDLDPSTYDVPLSLKTYIPKSWKSVQVMSKGQEITPGVEISKDKQGHYIRYNASPIHGKVIISATS